MTTLFRRTDWRFVTSGGAEITVGAGKIAFLGASGGAYYVRQGDGPIYRLPYAGIVGGAGFGIFSTAGPVSVATSLPWAPGSGFAIYSNPLRRDTFGLEDFAGICVSWTASLNVMATSRSCTVLAFGAPRWVSAAGPLEANAILMSCAGFGTLWGSAITNFVAAGVSVMRGEIFGSQREEGETSLTIPSPIDWIL